MEKEVILDVFAERFSYLIKSNDTDISKLMSVLGIKSNTTIYRYMHAEMNPKLGTIKIIANFYNVNPTWLMGYDVPMANPVKTDLFGNSVSSIPLLGTVKAGYDYLAEENWIGTIDIDNKLAESGDFFALRIKGDSMTPDLKEDDIVIVKKQDDFENGDIVVALINGNEATVKKGKKSGDTILLQPLNNNYEPLIFDSNDMKSLPVHIIGVVKESRRKH